MRRRSRSASSASATLMVMTPPVPGQHRGAGLSAVGQELERQPVAGSSSGRPPAAGAAAGVDEPPLGDLELVPGLALPRASKIGNDAGQPARRAQRVRVVGRAPPSCRRCARCNSRTADSRTVRRRPAARPRPRRRRGSSEPDHADVGQVRPPGRSSRSWAFEEEQVVAVVAVKRSASLRLVTETCRFRRNALPACVELASDRLRAHPFDGRFHAQSRHRFAERGPGTPPAATPVARRARRPAVARRLRLSASVDGASVGRHARSRRGRRGGRASQSLHARGAFSITATGPPSCPAPRR